ncbi:MAG: hypothetical protein H8E44_04805 [Planctomycetes bacterium]|nr:hypothetical protein [Planctomycetota bacterium]MBL7038931.1 hypothetical protein [Pirellulaceae bacterium]
MTLTVELPPSLEQRIRDRAAELGGDPETVVANLVRNHFAAAVDSPFVALTEEETKWFNQVNEIPTAGVRERWRELDGLRRAGTLDENQQAEMTKLYDQIEANHARRIEAAAELAKLWQVSLDSVIDQLGLSPSGEDD